MLGWVLLASGVSQCPPQQSTQAIVKLLITSLMHNCSQSDVNVGRPWEGRTSPKPVSGGMVKTDDASMGDVVGHIGGVEASGKSLRSSQDRAGASHPKQQHNNRRLQSAEEAPHAPIAGGGGRSKDE
jgi:hypothetical protein